MGVGGWGGIAGDEEGMERKWGDRETQRERREGGSPREQRATLAPGICVTCESHRMWLTGERSLRTQPHEFLEKSELQAHS